MPKPKRLNDESLSPTLHNLITAARGDATHLARLESRAGREAAARRSPRRRAAPESAKQRKAAAKFNQAITRLYSAAWRDLVAASDAAQRGEPDASRRLLRSLHARLHLFLADDV